MSQIGPKRPRIEDAPDPIASLIAQLGKANERADKAAEDAIQASERTRQRNFWR